MRTAGVDAEGQSYSVALYPSCSQAHDNGKGDHALRKAYAETRHGQIHYVEAGSGHAVLLLHQTPRSWTEYEDVIPLLADQQRVIAVDTLGFGPSDQPRQRWSISLFVDGVEDLIDALALARISIVGHHTGGVIALELAARYPERVRSLVLSGVPYVDRARRGRVAHRATIDGIPISDDGSHYQLLWNKRAGFYPPDRPDLMRRFMIDAVRVGERGEEGHIAVNEYRMEDRIGFVRARTLIVCGEHDRFSLPDVPKLRERISGAESTVLSGVEVSSADHDPKQFASIVDSFLVRCS